MNRKVVVGGVLALITVGVVFATRKSTTEPSAEVAKQAVESEPAADTPAVVEQPADTTPAPVAKPQEQPAAAVAEDAPMQDQLDESIRAFTPMTKVADINSVECTQDGKCVVEVEAKTEEANVQMPLWDFLRAHPEFGLNVRFDTNENPRVTKFVFAKEKEMLR